MPVIYQAGQILCRHYRCNVSLMFKNKQQQSRYIDLMQQSEYRFWYRTLFSNTTGSYTSEWGECPFPTPPAFATPRTGNALYFNNKTGNYNTGANGYQSLPQHRFCNTEVNAAPRPIQILLRLATPRMGIRALFSKHHWVFQCCSWSKILL